MARTRVIPPDSPELPPDFDSFPGDDLTPDQVDQAEVGSLFSIQGPEFANVHWSIHRYRTRAEITAEPGADKGWVADIDGELKGSELVAHIGGGRFQFLGYVPRDDRRGTKIKYNRTITIEAPRKDFTTPPKPDPEPVSASITPATDPVLVRLLEHNNAILNQLVGALASRGDDKPASSMKEIVETLVALEGLRPTPPPPPPPPTTEKDIVNTYFAMVQKGIELGQSREPAPSAEPTGTDWAKVIEASAPILERFLGQVAARRRAAYPPGPGAPPPPAEPSVASVVDDPPPAGPQVGHRWATAVEALARAIAAGDDPSDFVATLEAILDPQEYGLLRFASLEQVNERLAPAMEGLPVLKLGHGQAFIQSVLEEIQTSPTQ